MSDNTSKWRDLHGAEKILGLGALLLPVLLASLWAVEVQRWIGVLIYKEQFLGLMLASGLTAVFVNIRARRSENGARVPWYDWILVAISLAGTLYVVINYHWLIYEMSGLEPLRIALGALLILAIFEAVRRLIGWTLIIVAVFFLLYARFGGMMPGIFAVPSSSWERIVIYSYLDTTALFGLPLDVAANTIVTFILFGAMLRITKGDTFITDLALCMMGKYRGGPAKVSVAASTLFGTVSGSAVSNVAVVGPISIPMMEKSGYPREQAAAIEAVSSTGGQIMPPVMGITAFLMADFLSVPYSDVVLAALLPALLYYVAVFVQVDLEAGKRGLRGISVADLPRFVATLKRGFGFIVPLGVLIYGVMFAFWAPGKAGLAAAAAALLVGMIDPRARPNRAEIFGALVDTGRTVTSILILTAIAGLVIGALQLAGLAYSMSSILLALAGNSVLLILLMTAVICVVLGMALPTAVIYTMLAVLVAPALVDLGVDRMAAHLFIFYMGMLSMITPPVCFASFTAAAIAGANFWKTAIVGMRYGVAAYLLPFVFPFSMGLLMEGTFLEIAWAVASAVLGLTAISAGLVGYLFRPLNPVFRVALIGAGFVGMMSPFGSQLGEMMNLGGLAVCVLIALVEWFAVARLRSTPNRA
ncbi:TRAP transporter fused permease subunit [Puniceibacterium sp. IMCC21224]|uniref:TRAP transporter permease n=1 Tax=Puniceibacterium sp. IMCC21224 TaxID=1618204 RepID=UPI00064DAC15|nr:TRAP transporter fused permease subunit [Puniceibacterium sp. IMCC21224]KMK68490.1 TRAP transporter, 4TM/12TM fusion protein [Puniceibacterium sp. IMCC21224]